MVEGTDQAGQMEFPFLCFVTSCIAQAPCPTSVNQHRLLIQVQSQQRCLHPVPQENTQVQYISASPSLPLV
uniref:Uncharacterized protein n=1 Tax=Anguilla anguilla TaxID=7936 RepID=A0A0E9SN83_ANGAN